MKGKLNTCFVILAALIPALSNAQTADAGVNAAYTQTSFSQPTEEGYFFNFSYEDTTAAVSTDGNSGFTLSGESIKAYSATGPTYVDFDGFFASDAASVRSTVSGKDYSATFVQDGSAANYSSTVTSSFPAMPPAPLYVTDVGTSGTAAYWNEFNQLVLSSDSVYTLNFNTFTNQPDYMMIYLEGPDLYYDKEALQANGDSAITSQEIDASTLIAGAIYDAEAIVANLASPEMGTLTVGSESMSLQANNYQGHYNTFEIYIVPETATFAHFAGFSALLLALCLRSQRNRRLD